MPTHVLKYGSYTFKNSFHYREISNGYASTNNKLPLQHGANVVARYKNERRVLVEGTLMANDMLSGGYDFTTEMDALRLALDSGPAALQLDSDRILPDSFCIDMPENYDPMSPLKWANMRLTFVCPYAYFSSATETTSPTNLVNETPETISKTIGGNAPALPLLSLTVGATGVLDATITNTTTGRVFTLNGSVTNADVIEVNSLYGTVKIGAVDKIAMFEGMFIELIPGVNNLQIEYDGAVTITNLGITYRARYR